MTEINLNKMYFMLFDICAYEQIIELYKKYKYMTNDPSARIIYHISNALISDISELQASIEYLYKAKATEEFPNPKGFIPSIIKERHTSAAPKYQSIENNPVYNSPQYNMITVNGNAYDDQMDLIRTLNRYLTDPVIFKNRVSELKDEWYAHYLKLLHAVQTNDIEYGLNAATYFIENPVRDFSPFMIIIQLMEARQRIDVDADLSKLHSKMEAVLKDTIYSLNLIKLKKWKLSEIEYAKELNKQIKHLESNHSKEFIDDYMKSII